jgi:hypothetical protein
MHITDIASDILAEIFSYLLPVNLSSLNPMCKLFHRLLENDNIWRQSVYNEFGGTIMYREIPRKSSSVTWRQYRSSIVYTDMEHQEDISVNQLYILQERFLNSLDDTEVSNFVSETRYTGEYFYITGTHRQAIRQCFDNDILSIDKLTAFPRPVKSYTREVYVSEDGIEHYYISVETLIKVIDKERILHRIGDSLENSEWRDVTILDCDIRHAPRSYYIFSIPPFSEYGRLGDKVINRIVKSCPFEGGVVGYINYGLVAFNAKELLSMAYHIFYVEDRYGEFYPDNIYDDIEDFLKELVPIKLLE